MKPAWIFSLLFAGLLAFQQNAPGADPIETKPLASANLRGSKTSHWAFVAPARPRIPPCKNQGWIRNPIDNFILARLEKDGLKPAPEADRATLLRRATLDLIGLPPTPDELDVFLKDRRPDAYPAAIDRLLHSPHYGERWGRHWLDDARYADSNGYSIDAPRQIWKYRDWVIQALNHDLPFDEFAIEQLAGDLLPNATPSQRIATGFHRNTQINEEGGIDKEQFRVESIIDRVNTTGAAFLGLTIGCAQCHDHKFDPISQREYYQLFAFFNNTEEPSMEVVGEPLPNRDLKEQIEETEADLDRYIDSASGPQRAWEEALSPAELAAFDPELAAALKTAPKERTRPQKRAVYQAFKAEDPEFARRQKKLAALTKKENQWVTTLVLAERDQPRESYLFVKGDFTRHGAPVTPGTPSVLPPLAAGERPTRLDLARWIVAPENPLTARVIVNRIWQEYFGRGIVETENDFGTQGTPPTHPELLDWLATELMARHWSLKEIHRLIVTSATYRQSSNLRPELDRIDAANKLLARQSRLRLDAEIVRDVALSASGLLNPQVGGPSVFPPQPEGVMNLGQSRRPWKASTGPERYRRGLYTFLWRATPHPALALFDAPDAFSTCTRRIRSNTPLQALTLLNDPQFYEFAQGLAARLLSAPARDPRSRIDYAFRLCLARPPTQAEAGRLGEFLSQQLTAEERSRPVQPSIPETLPPGVRPAEFAAWTALSRVILNLDETITRE